MEMNCLQSFMFLSNYTKWLKFYKSDAKWHFQQDEKVKKITMTVDSKWTHYIYALTAYFQKIDTASMLWGHFLKFSDLNFLNFINSQTAAT